MAIALFYALGTLIGGVAAPWLFGQLIGAGVHAVAWGYARCGRADADRRRDGGVSWHRCGREIFGVHCGAVVRLSKRWVGRAGPPQTPRRDFANSPRAGFLYKPGYEAALALHRPGFHSAAAAP